MAGEEKEPIKKAGLGKEEIEWAVLGAWDIVITGVAKERKSLSVSREGRWSIESRSKLKSIGVALFEHEDPGAGILHFVKYAEYMLPRSDLNMTLDALLKKVAEARKKCSDSKIQREMISHLVGYLCWSIDAFCKLLEDSNASQNVENARDPLKNMLEAELTTLNISEEERKKRIDHYMNALIEWAKKTKESSERYSRR